MPLVPSPAFPPIFHAIVSPSEECKLALVDLDRLRELLNSGQTQNLCAEWLSTQPTMPSQQGRAGNQAATAQHKENGGELRYGADNGTGLIASWNMNDLPQDRPPKGVCEQNGDEQGRFQGLHQEKRRSEWLGGRIAAKVAVLDYLRSRRSQGDNKNPLWKATSFPIRSTPAGRPFLASESRIYGREAPYISISHSQKYALAVAAATPCGIDIQVSSATLLRVKDRFCSPQEETTLAANLPTLTELERLTLLWAAKEAVKKRAVSGPLPGFLEMALSHIYSCQPCQDSAGTPPCFSLHFSFLMQSNPEWRKETAGPVGISVVVGLHQNYGLALCLLAQDENGENNA